MGVEAATSAIVPATPEALLQLILSLEEPEDGAVLSSKTKKQKKSSDKELSPDRGQTFPWRAVALTSAVWLSALVVLGAKLTSQIQGQDQRLQQLIERLGSK
jgi:ABC-type nitrate/sulfonate/bicarbonate transport system ATPase subunit